LSRAALLAADVRLNCRGKWLSSLLFAHPLPRRQIVCGKISALQTSLPKVLLEATAHWLSAAAKNIKRERTAAGAGSPRSPCTRRPRGSAIVDKIGFCRSDLAQLRPLPSGTGEKLPAFPATGGRMVASPEHVARGGGIASAFARHGGRRSGAAAAG
jgi:hypothetical protein